MFIFRVLIYSLFTLSIMSCSCKSIKYDNTKRVVKDAENSYLKEIGADQEEYSVVIFIGGYNGENISIKENNQILFEEKIFPKNNSGLGAVKVLDRNHDFVILSNGKKILKISKSKLIKYKYIYISKYRIYKKYEITFSNTFYGYS